jgi:hypothetical protein
MLGMLFLQWSFWGVKRGVGFETQRHRGTEKDRRENRERPEKRVGERKSRGELREGEGVKKRGKEGDNQMG